MHGHLAQHLCSSQPKGHPPTLRETWGNLGENRGGVEKSGMLEHKSGNISETCEDRGKVTMESLTLFRTVPSPATPSPRLGVRNPTVKMQSLLSQERLKLGTSNLVGIFTGSIRTQGHEKFWRKRERGRIQGLPKFFEYPLLSQERVKLQLP